MAGQQILLVEDNAKNMKLLRDVLRATGYRTLEASTAGQGLMLATELRPVLVLMDIRLPDMDGLEALGRLRTDERTASIPVFAVTAQAMKGDRERFKAAGFDGYLSKPLDIDELIATVARHCGAQRVSDDPQPVRDEREGRPIDPQRQLGWPNHNQPDGCGPPVHAARTPSGARPDRSPPCRAAQPRRPCARGRVFQVHFARVFAAAYGETPRGYLTRRRLERAKTLLRTANLTVTEVCFTVGFESLGSFSSLFRRVVGQSPSGYQRASAQSGGPPRSPAASC